ncbi:Hypothetical protein D9617_27g045250 [Elsinoe fawcettii]|nr:Hypothetical protein D9617_27g045250 [Elsinoe fawcettii]
MATKVESVSAVSPGNEPAVVPLAKLGFLSLPPELRSMVYKHMQYDTRKPSQKVIYAYDTVQYRYRFRQGKIYRDLWMLSRTCKVIRAEVIEPWYRKGSFYINMAPKVVLRHGGRVLIERNDIGFQSPGFDFGLMERLYFKIDVGNKDWVDHAVNLIRVMGKVPRLREFRLSFELERYKPGLKPNRHVEGVGRVMHALGTAALPISVTMQASGWGGTELAWKLRSCEDARMKGLLLGKKPSAPLETDKLSNRPDAQHQE